MMSKHERQILIAVRLKTGEAAQVKHSARTTASFVRLAGEYVESGIMERARDGFALTVAGLATLLTKAQRHALESWTDVGAARGTSNTMPPRVQDMARIYYAVCIGLVRLRLTRWRKIGGERVMVLTEDGVAVCGALKISPGAGLAATALEEMSR